MGVKGKTEDLTNQKKNLTNSFPFPLLLRLSTTVCSAVSWADLRTDGQKEIQKRNYKSYVHVDFSKARKRRREKCLFSPLYLLLHAVQLNSNLFLLFFTAQRCGVVCTCCCLLFFSQLLLLLCAPRLKDKREKLFIVVSLLMLFMIFNASIYLLNSGLGIFFYFVSF